MTRNLTGKVASTAAWKEKVKTPGTATFTAGNAICAYWRLYNNSNTNNGSRFCQNLKISVSWGYELTPSVSNMPKTVTTDTFKPTTSIVRSGSDHNTADNTQWQSTRLIVPKGQTLAYPEHSNVLVSDHDPCKLYKGNKTRISCDRLEGEAKQGAISSAGLNRTPTVDVTGNYSTGDKVCVVMSAKNRSHYYANWNHAIKCSGWGMSPKVQVWGGDLQVGRTFSGSSPKKSKIETSLSRKTIETTQIKAATTSADGTGDISGLWKTGVNASATKVAGNQVDQHWDVRRVINSAGKSTCAKGYVSSISDIVKEGKLTAGSLQGPSPATDVGNVYWQARTINENSTNTKAGNLGVNDSAVIGDRHSTVVDFIWNRTSGSARWIGLNAYGHDYSSAAACKAPATGEDHKNANTYIFRLKNGINIKDTVDLDSVNLTVEGAVDNLVKFYVNGCELKAAPGMKMASLGDRWQQPGWTISSKAGATGQCINGTNAFKHGNNTFEIHVRSTYSHTGLLVDKFVVSATKTETGKSNQTFGSWGEYALISPSAIKNMASGAGLNDGAEGNTSDVQASWSRMTFGNSGITKSAGCASDTGHGCYQTKNPGIPDISSKFTYSSAKPVNSSGGVWNVASIANENRSDEYRNIKPTTNGELRLTGGTIGKGKWLVVNAPNSTVRVTQNINYTNDSLSSNLEIPQLVIIAKNILIDAGVTQVDAWLIAKNGGIDTCGDGPVELTSNDCNKQIRINGPVLADRLILRRTAGSEANDLGEPAEIINLRPDAYLWLNARQHQRALRTTNLKELPPRY